MTRAAASVRIWIATGHNDMRNYVERTVMQSRGGMLRPPRLFW